MRVLSLFSGIGGLDLGLERAGMTVVGQCEIDPYCRKVLAKHWPGVPCWSDVKELTGAEVKAKCGNIDLICGGFPCQDISNAGKRAGIDGERSGLWSEYHRIICEVRPRFVLVENVAALLVRGLDRVLGELAESGYDAEWDCVPAAAFGAFHIRDRLFLIGVCADSAGGAEFVDSIGGVQMQRHSKPDAHGRRGIFRHVPDSDTSSVQSQGLWRNPRWSWSAEQLAGLVQSEVQLSVPAGSRGRVSDGLPNRMDRLHALGNAVVPQVAEFVGRAIMKSLSPVSPPPPGR